MTAFLPPNLLALFAPRDPVPYAAPVAKLGHEKKRLGYGAVSAFLKEFEDPKDTPPPTRVETRDERTERKRREKAEQVAYKLEQDLAMWDPASNTDGTRDPFKTLFVARVNYDSSESKLRREFETYGPVRKIRLVLDKKSDKPRGYAFIEYEREKDMHNAYKNADGKKIDGRRVLVDVERGRTVKGWRPRRLGGGLGGTRRGGPDENNKFSGREDNSRRDDDRRDDERSERTERPRKRSRSREAVPDKREERRRSRSRERRRRSRSRDRKKDIRDDEEKKHKRTRRSRSRDRGRRSKSRERRRGRKSRDRGGAPADSGDKNTSLIDTSVDQGYDGQQPPPFEGEYGSGDVAMKEDYVNEQYTNDVENGEQNEYSTNYGDY